MKISVIIPVFNRSEMVSRALDSVLTQTRRADEILVVDDGSTDGTNKVLDSFDGIKIIRHEKNKGVAAARNSGISAANYEWIAFLDSDDIWKTTKLEQNEYYFEMDSSIRIFQNQEIWYQKRQVCKSKEKTP